MKTHRCDIDHHPGCCCRVDADEPNWKCTVHSGYRDYPLHCSTCGRFVSSNLAFEDVEPDFYAKVERRK